jgi:membrane protein required for colicin V production
MLLDLILGLVLCLMFAVGAWRGAIVSGSGLFALISGYAGGILAATKGSAWVAQTLVVSPLLAPAVAGTIGFVVVWLVVSSIADIVVAWDRERVELTGRGLFDRALGGFFGLARGGLIVVLLAVLASWLDAARDIGAISGLSAIPDAESSVLAQATGTVVEVLVGAALADAGPAGEVAARLTARPGQALGSVQAILEDDRLNSMLEDRLFWTLISNNSIDYAMNRTAIRSIVNDPEMRGRFADLGLVGEAARDDVDVFRDTMAEVLAEVGPKIQRLQQDPELRALAGDPEIVALIEAGNTFALMNHPRIRQIVSRVSSDL